MALQIRKLYNEGMSLYKMRLIAGKSGLDNLVQWVHTIEDEEASSFLHGQELVFTAGIRNTNKNWLLDFAKRLNNVGTSAFVINLGPHIKEVPQEVIDFCNEVNMPLFTIPWEIRLVDVTRNFCEKIIHSDNIESSLASAIKNILFEIGDKETQILQMERYGFMRDNAFCFLCISAKEDNNSVLTEKYKRLSRYAEKAGRSIRDLFIHFVYKEALILVLVEYSEVEVNHFLDDFMYNIKNANVMADIYIGVSSIISGISDQRNNFENAINTNKIAVRNNTSIVRYDRLGLTKIFMDVKDKNLLYDYYYTIIGKIEQYDKENGTGLLDFLKIYISCNGSPQLVSEKQYIHRNTVNNMIKKIERITGYNLLNLEAKVICSIGLMIKDVL